MNEFKGKLGIYKIIETEDQTKTLWSEYFNENCHNTSGARLETIHNYIKGCEIEKQTQIHSPLNILDVGFGPGMGLLYLSEIIQSKKIINYFSIEIDPILVIWALENTFRIKSFNEINSDNLTRICFELNNISVTILIGDARETLPIAKNLGLVPPIHAIFQDAFSPKKNPSLWTVEWFQLMARISHQEVYLTTYSSSVSIRKSMIEAGFKIENKIGFGKKKSMTHARLTGETNSELLLDLSRSPILPLHDI